MRRALLVLSVLGAAVSLVSGPAAAQDEIGALFADSLFAEERITQSVRERPDVSWLDKADMNDLLLARQALSGFFQKLRAGWQGGAAPFLTPELARRYPEKDMLRRERFGAETYLSFEIIDFRIADDNSEIKLRYFLSENDRGRALIRQRAVTFLRVGAEWRISEFDNFEFE